MVKEVHKENGLMRGASRTLGFSFIELIVAITIIGIMATLVVPRFFQRTKPVGEVFITDLNTLLQHAILDAMSDGRLHRIRFDFERDRVVLEAAKRLDADPADMSEQFVPVESPYVVTYLEWPNVLEMKHFFIGKVDEMFGGTTKEVWFFVGNDGTVQDVTLVIRDDERDKTVSLVTNPFTAQLTVYDGIRKP